MSILYQNIAKAVALRANQLKDATDAATFNTDYAATFAATSMSGLEVPFAALKQSVLASEKCLADLCGRSKNPILRNPLIGTTGNILNYGRLPSVSVTGVEFIGAFGNVLDSVTKQPLTEKTKQEVLRFLRNAGAASSIYRLPAFHYCFEDSMIIHTRPNVVLEGCAWSATAQSALYDSPTGASPLAQNLESMWIADVLANLPQDQWFINEAQIYAGIAARGEQMILQGIISSAVLPDTTAGSEPIKN